MKLQKHVEETHEEILKTPLGEFLKEAEEIGYTYFFKDIIRKVLVSRLKKKGVVPPS